MEQMRKVQSEKDQMSEVERLREEIKYLENDLEGADRQLDKTKKESECRICEVQRRMQHRLECRMRY